MTSIFRNFILNLYIINYYKQTKNKRITLSIVTRCFYLHSGIYCVVYTNK